MHQKINFENIICCRFTTMKRFLFYISLLNCIAFTQPKEGIEFKLNTISGVVLDSITSKPLMDVDIDIFTGNNILKHSTITDENGFYTRKIVGYLWKPKIRFSMHNYQPKKFNLNPKNLDSLMNMLVNIKLAPVPEHLKIPDLKRSTITTRAETFFIQGNIFYNLLSNGQAERIFIHSAKAIETEPDFIVMKVNENIYDIARCYVPQEGKYENLSFILQSLLRQPIFKRSENPVYLNEGLLEPSIIYGSVINVLTGNPVMGAEIILEEPYKRRISDETGKYAFQVEESGVYRLSINPPPRFYNISISNQEVLIKYGTGGLYRSNFYVKP
mgnify:FL=1